MINFIRIYLYFSRVFFVLLVILTICLLFEIIKITVLPYILFIAVQNGSITLDRPQCICDILKILDGVAIVEKLNCGFAF